MICTELERTDRPVMRISSPSPAAPHLQSFPLNNHVQLFWLFLDFISMFINNMFAWLLLDFPV